MATRLDTLQEKVHCRAGGGPLRNVLNLGELHLSGFVDPEEPDTPRYPLQVCQAEDSGLVQLRHTVNPDLMYRNYHYRSGMNEQMAHHLRSIAAEAEVFNSLEAGDYVLDIGANDGTLLSAYSDELVTVAFEPSAILPDHADIAIHDFFSAAAYWQRCRVKAKVVTSIAMFYDLDDPVDFARQVADVLADDGLWIIEMHYLPSMIKEAGFDAICHEHLAYYNLNSLEYVLGQAGLTVTDVQTNAVNGGSFRVTVRKGGSPTRRVGQFRAWEAPVDWKWFKTQMQMNGTSLRQRLERVKRQGGLCLGYGASTKGNTLLQVYDIGPDLLPYIADRNPDKWGKVTTGTRIPICSEDDARRMMPTHLLALPYHFIASFKLREAAFLKRGGRFIVPTPFPHEVVADV